MTEFEQFESDVAGLRSLQTEAPGRREAVAASFRARHAALAGRDRDRVFAHAVQEYNRGHVFAAEQICRLLLNGAGRDLKALHLLATIAARLGNHEDAASLLLDCLDMNPFLPFVRFDLANAFFRSGRFDLALGQCDELKSQDAANLDYAALRAASLVKLGRYGEAIEEYERILAAGPDSDVLLRYGIALRIVGRTHEAIAAFRAAIARGPNTGEAYWNLANLKTFRFEPGDVDAMREAAKAEATPAQDRPFLEFALGKALDDAGRYDEAFQHYAAANELVRRSRPYDPEAVSTLVARNRDVFDAGYFQALDGGCEAPDPVFIVGLPRSGSTLLEQILASHSAVDATMELTEIPAMVRSLDNPNRTGRTAQFPEVLAELGPDELSRLGEEYLKRTKPFRGDRPMFIDKTPNNFLHIGLIASILPNAKIIDARRHPCGAGFSIYTQYFARGSGFAYDLADIGRYYRDYLHLMDHWHAVLPGRILTVRYEDVVADMETRVRELLAFCGLEFEPQCLEFHRSRRAVATVSSEQVRQPIYDSALEHWRHYERYLAPLKTALEATPSASTR